MSIQKNWWELTGCGSRFCEDVIRLLEESKSIAVTGTKIPWFDTFYERLKGAGISASKVFECVNGEDISKPGDYLFNRYCSPEIQAKYWPDQPSYTHADFLAETEGITLNQRFIIVRNLVTEKAFLRWKEFVEKYIKCIESSGTDTAVRAVFVLEYQGVTNQNSHKSPIAVVSFDPREVYVFTYNLINTAEEYDGYLLNKYAAELIGEICGRDIEQCGLLSDFAGLLNDPCKTYSLFSDEFPSRYRQSESQINVAVLSAQFKVIFPLIEQKRRELIDKYFDSICLCLPWTNDYCEEKNEPYDMELRDLVFKSGEIKVTESDRELIKTLRDARNQLAHNHVLSYEVIYRLANFNY